MSIKLDFQKATPEGPGANSNIVAPPTVSPAEKLRCSVSALFNEHVNDANAVGSINNFLRLAVDYHQETYNGRLEGLDFGEMTYLFKSPQFPNYALLVSHNDAFLKEFQTICTKHNEWGRRQSQLVPRIVAQKDFLETTYDRNLPRKQRVKMEFAKPGALLLTDFKHLNLNAIRDAGIKITSAIPKMPHGNYPTEVAYRAHPEDIMFELIAERLTMSASAAVSLKDIGKFIVDKIRRKSSKKVLAA